MGPEIFFDCSESGVLVTFPTISKRIKDLVGAGQTKILDKFTDIQHLAWDGNRLCLAANDGTVRPRALSASQRDLVLLLWWISKYEVKEATDLIELAMWKAKMKESGKQSIDERLECRGNVNVPDPVKDIILQYLK